MDLIELIYNEYINTPVHHGKELSRLIELEEYFNKTLTEEQFKLFKEFDDNLMELRIQSEQRLIKFVINILKVLFV